jgi:GT2 family glycosyltransferase
MQDMNSPAKGMMPGSLTDMSTVLGGQEQWSAATGACLMVRAEDFDRIGGFDENFAVAYNDLDFADGLTAMAMPLL